MMNSKDVGSEIAYWLRCAKRTVDKTNFDLCLYWIDNLIREAKKELREDYKKRTHLKRNG